MTWPRVVSLLPSATEIVAALSLEQCLVGRSHECDFPATVLQLPVCSRPRIVVSGSSRDIDRHVTDALRDGLSIYEIDAERLAESRPDVILTQTQCDVCAVSLSDIQAAVGRLTGEPPEIVSLEARALAEVWVDIRHVGESLAVPDRAVRLLGQLTTRLEQLSEKTAAFADRPTIACLEWLDPLMAAGNWMPELVEIAGGRNLFGRTGEHSARLDWTELTAADPDVVVVMPCGWNIARTRVDLAALADRPGWSGLTAVATDCVFLTDGHQFFNRPGPRLVESAEILAEVLHPDVFDFGHEGIGWQRL